MVLRGRWQGKERERTIVVITVVYPDVSQLRKAVFGYFASDERIWTFGDKRKHDKERNCLASKKGRKNIM